MRGGRGTSAPPLYSAGILVFHSSPPLLRAPARFPREGCAVSLLALTSRQQQFPNKKGQQIIFPQPFPPLAATPCSSQHIPGKPGSRALPARAEGSPFPRVPFPESGLWECRAGRNGQHLPAGLRSAQGAASRQEKLGKRRFPRDCHLPGGSPASWNLGHRRSTNLVLFYLGKKEKAT